MVPRDGDLVCFIPEIDRSTTQCNTIIQCGSFGSSPGFSGTFKYKDSDSEQITHLDIISRANECRTKLMTCK